MKEDKSDNQIPALKFLNKHKWRIILPVLFVLFYFTLPRYFSDHIAVQQNLFIKLSNLSQNELTSEINTVRIRILSDEFLQNLIVKYDLYHKEKTNGTDEKQLIEKLRKVVEIRLEDEDLIEGIAVHVWIYFVDGENSRHIAELSNDVAAQFENIQNTHTDKYVTKPYDAAGYRNWGFFGGIVQGLVLISLPLIFLWEIPNMFYAPKTKEMIFDPLKSDWQSELTDAKLRKQTLKAFKINIQYSYAFLAAMIQKSPLGDLFEFISKFAK